MSMRICAISVLQCPHISGIYSEWYSRDNQHHTRTRFSETTVLYAGICLSIDKEIGRVEHEREYLCRSVDNPMTESNAPASCWRFCV